MVLNRSVVVLALLVVGSTLVQGKKKGGDNGDDLYILLEEISVFACRGVKNEIKIAEEDVNIVNERGNKAYYIKAPGNYSLHFQKINVLDNFGHLTGEIGITLQVPILEGPAGIRFDVPYTMVPETGLLNQQCDDHSGIVERDGRQYCRYCELCGLSEKIEKGLKKNNVLGETLKTKDSSSVPKCGKINSNNYEFKRSINLPGRKELENKIKDKVQGIDGEVKKRLNKGRGRFQVFLNLISASQPPISQKSWFDGSDQCRSCMPKQGSNTPMNFLYCNTEDCKSAWAQQCLHNSAKIVGCYTVEFNYRMTTNYNDVVKFLKENNYPNQDTLTPVTTTTEVPAVEEKAPPPSAPSGGSKSETCVAKMAQRLTHLRRYCTIFWNEKLCCQHCEGVC
uniref:ADAM_spacer1 domain-containing protein n=1 Tax=Rhabditophanes sp. KR3021 TaxID=114890 RepID=A0AC35U9D8_9BILA